MSLYIARHADGRVLTSTLSSWRNVAVKARNSECANRPDLKRAWPVVKVEIRTIKPPVAPSGEKGAER